MDGDVFPTDTSEHITLLENKILDDFGSVAHPGGISEESAPGVENTNILKNNHLDSDSENEIMSWSVQQLLAKMCE